MATTTNDSCQCSRSARRHGWRSRWAAVGAAVAVTLGAGGLYTARAASQASTFTAISPVRVLDTRSGAGLSGLFVSDSPRQLDVTGTIPIVLPGGTVGTGTVVPDGASGIVANVTAVLPSSAGFVAVRPGGSTGMPTTSNLNVKGGDVVPNSVTVEIPTSGAMTGVVDLWYHAAEPGATTHLLVDIVGYYMPSSGAGPRGLSAWDTIPSGQTVTGEILYDTHSAGVNNSADGVLVTLPAKAPVPLTDSMVNFAPSLYADDDDPTCTGTTTAPTAPAGKVCVYLAVNAGVEVGGFAAEYLPTSGFVVMAFELINPAGNDQWFTATWAYTAP